MSSLNCCEFGRTIDAYFDGSLPASSEPSMSDHLPSCEGCTRRYERHLILESLDPTAPGSKERMARSLWKRARPPGVLRFLPIAGGALAAAAAIVVLVGAPHRPPSEGSASQFHARGEAVNHDDPRISIYVVRDGQPPVPAGETLDREDPLAFAYENPSGRKRLLVFGVDENKRVAWYHPAWNDASATPVALPIEPSKTRIELKEKIRHALTGKQLRIYAAFVDEPVSVREVEARVLASPPLAERIGIPSANESSQLFSLR